MNKDLATEILPRTLWVVMVVCLYLGQHLMNSPPKLTDDVLLACLGVSLATAGFLLWMYVAYYMRHALFDKTLVTGGPFEYMRHPMYVSIYIMFMLAFTPIWYLGCKLEEKQITELYGRKYQEYKERTGMFFPRTGMVMKK
ncbi:MAG: methyltransferase [Candidatus Altiarchaeota archaeon]|nr:methyltransferase [Candidatus Altiarchaeota archaeon]